MHWIKTLEIIMIRSYNTGIYNKIPVSIDESTDTDGRYDGNVIIETLEVNKPGKA